MIWGPKRGIPRAPAKPLTLVSLILIGKLHRLFVLPPRLLEPTTDVSLDRPGIFVFGLDVRKPAYDLRPGQKLC